MLHSAFIYIYREATAATTKPPKRVYFHLYDFKMLLSIENPADCEVHVVTRFLSDKQFKEADIHRQIREDYSEHILSDTRKLQQHL